MTSSVATCTPYAYPEVNLIKATLDCLRDEGTPVEIIALYADRPRSGKDTIAQEILDLTKDKLPRKLAFATALRREVQSTFANQYVYNSELHAKLPFHLFSDTNMKDTPLYALSPSNVSAHEYYQYLVVCEHIDPNTAMSARQHLQIYGNNFVKDYLGEIDYWVGKLAQEMYYDVTFRGSRLLVVTDVRDPVEFAFLKHLGAKFIKVQREGFPDDGYDYSKAHPIEKHATNFEADIVLNNFYNDRGTTRWFLAEALGISLLTWDKDQENTN